MKGEKGKIVWIDHQWNEMSAVMKPLETAGYEIFPFINAQEALADEDTLKQADIIITEVLLYGQSGEDKWVGHELLETLANRAAISAPIVVFTSGVDKNYCAGGLLKRLGARDVILKPKLPSRFKLIVESVLIKS